MDGGFLRMQWGSFRGETYRWLLKNTPGYFGWLINKLKQDKLSPSDHLFLFKMTLIKYASMFPEGNEIVAIKEKKKKTTMINAGVGESQISAIFAELNLPGISKTALKARSREIGPSIECVAEISCTTAIQQEMKLLQAVNNM
ncbi:hypothetical protein MAR_004805 [Mya arenaria]|uniref:Mutator-like transposase domain-containing protein n=1 Tax=Mya arenaria TaxID=6604 RepID=A0ABY7EXU8_MYAAR|nr:hypothetical protein MAR_004805 [Mya arenaria]